jgi:hypothetical protein
MLAAFHATALSMLAAPIPAKQKQGALHGFLLLEAQDGKVIAVGDQTSYVHGDTMHCRLVFHFRDGSIDDEVATFRQTSVFQLIEDHHVQKGPAFPKQLDATINVPKGLVTWRESSKGKEETKQQHMKLPPDLVNGMISLVVENFPANASEFDVSYLAVGSKPRVVKMAVRPDGEDKILVGGDEQHAKRFNIHIDLGGVAGVVAPAIGKQPPDLKIWTLGSEIPVFVKLMGPIYEDGPVWTMLLAAPHWPS